MTPALPARRASPFPPDLARTGVDPAQMDMTRAELRFGLSDPRGLGANPRVSADGQPLRLQPGGGSERRPRLLRLDRRRRPAGASRSRSISPSIFRGNAVAEPRPAGRRHALDGPFVLAEPELRRRFPARARGRSATRASTPTYRIGNLALGRSLVSTGDAGAADAAGAGAATPAYAADVRRPAIDADRADQPDPAGRPLFAGQPRDQIRLPVHRLHLPRAADVRRDRRAFASRRSNIC